MSQIDFSPIGDRILLQRIEQIETVGGVIIPQNTNEKSNQGRVIAVGEGNRTTNNDLIPLDVSVGVSGLMETRI